MPPLTVHIPQVSQDFDGPIWPKSMSCSRPGTASHNKTHFTTRILTPENIKKYLRWWRSHSAKFSPPPQVSVYSFKVAVS